MSRDNRPYSHRYREDAMPDPAPSPIDWPIFFQRLWWTFVASFLGSPAVLAVISSINNADLTAVGLVLGSAVSAAATSVVNAVLLVARFKLSVLTTPT